MVPKESRFADRLFQARLSFSAARGKQVTQAELAEMADVSSAAWSTWEAGRSEPPLDTIKRVGLILGVDPGWLAFGTQPAGDGHPTTIPQQRRKLR